MKTMAERLAALEERKAWEVFHPELAAAWNEALAQDAERTERREAEARRRWLADDCVHQLGRYGVPSGVSKHLRQLDVTRVGVRAVQAWPQERFVLCLFGATGAGKSVPAAFACLGELGRDRWLNRSTGDKAEPVAWMSVHEVAKLSDFDDVGREVFERLELCGLLVLDEWGGDSPTEPGQARLERLVDARITHGRRTIITTNADEKALRARLGERIMSRLSQGGVAVNCGATDYRRAVDTPHPEETKHGQHGTHNPGRNAHARVGRDRAAGPARE